jgi:biotin carboxyl carrier protein
MPLETVESPLPGKILKVGVKVGDKIDDSGEICTIEAMKMETPILSTVSGTITEVAVSEGQAVKAGDKIAVIEY